MQQSPRYARVPSAPPSFPGWMPTGGDLEAGSLRTLHALLHSLSTKHSTSLGPGARALEEARCPGHSRLGGGDTPLWDMSPQTLTCRTTLPCRASPRWMSEPWV